MTQPSETISVPAAGTLQFCGREPRVSTKTWSVASVTEEWNF